MLQIRKLRKKLGMTQSELAQKIGVTFGTVSIWERGLRMPEWTTLQKMCELFGVTVQDLIENPETEEKQDEAEQKEQLIDAFIEEHETLCLREALAEACGMICQINKTGDRYTLSAELLHQSALGLMTAMEEQNAGK